MKNATKIFAIAHKTIEIESKAVERLRHSINGDFYDAVMLIGKSKGRLVVTGIGKSALIARKITATLNSTGTPALFMHASDAIHGDFGMVQSEDVVLCLSKSGTTSEFKTLVPMIKNRGATLVAMVGTPDTYLGQHANLVLHTPIEIEADYHNLVPTASTTVQLVLGDALAVCLSALRGFSSDDFARNHPGGALGKRLTLRVRDIFPQNQVPKVSSMTTVQKTIFEISSKRLGATAVVDDTDALLGIITDGDIRRMLMKHHQINGLTAADIMTKMPKHIAPEAKAVDAFGLMRNHNITQLPVVADDKYVGMIHLHDLIKEGMM